MAKQRIAEILFREQVDFLMIEKIVRYAEDSLSKHHFHDHLEIYYLVDGERNYLIGDKYHHIRPGDLVVVSGNVMHHATTFNSPYHERIILEVYSPMLQVMNEMFGEESPEKVLSGLGGVLHLTQTEQTRVQSLMNGLMQEMREKRYGYEAMIRCILAELLTFIIRRSTQGLSIDRMTISDKNIRIMEIVDFLAAHSAEKITLDEIAERFGISKFHLCRTFKEATGFTISEYINASRVMRARELLLTTNMSISDIAKEVGFESSTHFGKVFKQHRGRAPLAYRKNYWYEVPKK